MEVLPRGIWCLLATVPSPRSMPNPLEVQIGPWGCVLMIWTPVRPKSNSTKSCTSVVFELQLIYGVRIKLAINELAREKSSLFQAVYYLVLVICYIPYKPGYWLGIHALSLLSAQNQVFDLTVVREKSSMTLVVF